jgi:hypothetical protein
MKETVTSNNQSTTQFVSMQHKGMIPNAALQVKFLHHYGTIVSDNLRKTMIQILQTPKNSNTTGTVVDLLAKLLAGAANVPKDDTCLIAQQVIFDVYEIYKDLFSPILAEEVLFHFGSNGSYKLLKNSGFEGDHAAALKERLCYMSIELKDDELSVLGLKRWDKDGIVMVISNDHPIGPQDCEHGECKNADQVHYMLGGCTFSVKPKASKPWCWPLALHNDPPWDDELIQTHLIILGKKSFKELVHASLLKLPQLYRLVAEPD